LNNGAYDVHPTAAQSQQRLPGALDTGARVGHAVHTLLADRAQPYDKSFYSTFIAESASIGNEMLLNDYMVAQCANRSEKLYYLGQGLESIRTTYFRQVSFAEFELAIHEELEQSRPLSGARMSELYCGLLRQVLRRKPKGVMRLIRSTASSGPSCRISITTSTSISTQPRWPGRPGHRLRSSARARQPRERFLTLLRAGGSDYPYELYKRAGVDMATRALPCAGGAHEQAAR